ncbi:hypothetical protein LTSEUGA_1912 [Salmonella enterica subsp. enterica serovar Uganda str. R8-3404]|uniref:Uncharacterized protein n=1 Tax=Salmonella enterica subsp. enterica serovar Uganda str. R8-3404 TaxID=913083 RepID=A0A6C8H3C8_SALET|nr:hypothetical protein LTSEUGA_1912 [Salmonella enterica subsp. enterica serovar Uganda str. R8-3404]
MNGKKAFAPRSAKIRITGLENLILDFGNLLRRPGTRYADH